MNKFLCEAFWLPLVGEDSRPGLELYICVYVVLLMGAAFLQVAFAISTFLEIINVFKENKEKTALLSKLNCGLFFFPLRLSVTFQEWKTITQMWLDFSLKSSDN